MKERAGKEERRNGIAVFYASPRPLFFAPLTRSFHYFFHFSFLIYSIALSSEMSRVNCTFFNHKLTLHKFFRYSAIPGYIAVGDDDVDDDDDKCYRFRALSDSKDVATRPLGARDVSAMMVMDVLAAGTIWLHSQQPN